MQPIQDIHGWFPVMLTGELMGEIPYAPRGDREG